MEKNAIAILEKLGLSESEVQMYLTLVESGARTARELMMQTKAKRPTVYYALRQLMDRGLVLKQGAQGTERFQAEPPEVLTSLVKLQQQQLNELTEEVASIIPLLKKTGGVFESAPGVTYFQGTEAMKRAIMDTLYCKSGQIDAITPADNFFWQIGQTFSAAYIAERVARKIKTRNLWEKPLEPKILAQSFKGLSNARILPQQMIGHFRTTVFIYDQEVMYISSKDSGYILIVKSREHHELMKAMFESFWATGKEVKF